MAAERFVTILRETSPNVVLHASPSVERNHFCPVPVDVTVTAQQVEKLLGVQISSEKILSILQSIGFVAHQKGDVIAATVPTWRPDCAETVDLIEEVARHFGYDNIGKTIPHSTVHGRLSMMQQRRRIVRQVLVGLGLDEAMPSPFLAPGELIAVGLHENNVLRIANPLVADESLLRTSLRPGLLRSLKYNQSHRASRIGLWEIGHVYPTSGQQLPDEYEQLIIMVAGGDATVALSQWNALCDALSVGAQLDQNVVPPGLHPTRSASLTRGKKIVGVVGEVDPFVLDTLGIEGRVSILEVDLTTVLNETPKPVQARDVNRFPSSDLDLAFVMSEDIPAVQLQRAIRQAAGKKLVDLDLFDVYRGAGVPDNHRSLAFRLRLQQPGGTMTETDIADVQHACIAAAEKVGAQLRG
jgi:phenylalanyl-tRNA synthetase beta chain